MSMKQSVWYLGFFLCGVVGCADPPVGIQLRFVAEPALNTEAQVMSYINQLEVMVSKSGGFNSGNSVFEAIDIDDDKANELVLSRSLGDDVRRFPLYRLLFGGHPDATEVEIWARGLLQEEVTAVGTRVSAVFREQQNEEATLQLNLRALFRSPRVTLTLPHAGQEKVPPALGEIKVEFSKRIKQETVAGNLQVIYSGTDGERILLKGNKWQLVFNSVKAHGMEEETSTATLVLDNCSLRPGKYRIEARSGIKDQSGRPLDQDARKSGNNDFVASFSLEGKPSADPCSTETSTCKRDSDCNSDPSTLHYVCVREGASAGRCQAMPASCNNDNCPTGWVCSYQTSGGSDNTLGDGNAQCVPDCRELSEDMGESPCSAGTQCDEGTGLCIGTNSTATCTEGGVNCVECTDDGKCDAPLDPDGSCLSGYTGCQQGAGCDVNTGSCVWCTTQEGCCSNTGQANETGFDVCDLSISYCDPYSGQCISFSDGMQPNI